MAVHLTVDYYVIPRKGEALTWESPSTIVCRAVQADEPYQEFATSHGFLPCSSQ